MRTSANLTGKGLRILQWHLRNTLAAGERGRISGSFSASSNMGELMVVCWLGDWPAAFDQK
ncbi:MAG TPA: hypothetical protein PLH97_16420, partial [Verrucomicrobiota bacterium]|nr:hypothetical protein [Verrucomicrobiota bacterium]